MFVDSHCHLHLLDLKNDEGDLNRVMQRARDQKITELLCVCTELGEYPALLKIAQTYPEVTFSVGVHPNHEPGVVTPVEDLVEKAQHEKVVAIGETGLDYYRQDGDVEWQKQRFINHIHASISTKKPLIIHTRQAKVDTIAIMQQEQAQQAGGVMHCFTEDWETAKAALDLGFYISFSGIITFKNAVEIQDVARKVPLDRILIETDCPYLAPIPFRGKQNEPAYVRYVAEAIAALRNESLDSIANITRNNFLKLFAPQ